MSASTANSGRVWSQARRARAKPWLMKNWAASAPQAITKAEKRTDGKVQIAEAAPAAPPAAAAPAAPAAAAPQATRSALSMGPHRARGVRGRLPDGPRASRLEP